MRDPWWVPWIPFLASMVVASVTLVGIWINNATNRAAIAAADARAREDWRRQAVREVATEMLTEATRIRADIDRALGLDAGLLYAKPVPADLGRREALVINLLGDELGHGRLSPLVDRIIILGEDALLASSAALSAQCETVEIAARTLRAHLSRYQQTPDHQKYGPPGDDDAVLGILRGAEWENWLLQEPGQRFIDAIRAASANNIRQRAHDFTMAVRDVIGSKNKK